MNFFFHSFEILYYQESVLKEEKPYLNLTALLRNIDYILRFIWGGGPFPTPIKCNATPGQTRERLLI